MKKMIKKIREAKTWRERADIARDEWPGTPSDELFEKAHSAKKMENKYPSIALEDLQYLGAWLATRILRREVQVVHDLATDLAKLKQHKPKPDYDLIVLYELTGLYPPGWEKTWGIDSLTGKMAPGYKPIPKGTRTTIAMRDIRKSLEKKLRRKLDDEEWNRRRKRINRHAKESEIQLDVTPSSRP